jgi:mono/diheme cytochrome c family protein
VGHDNNAKVACRMFPRVIAAWLVALCLIVRWSAASQMAGGQSVRVGVYTAEQARRGQQQYDVFCLGCHGTELEGAGVDVPALVDTAFVRKWSGRPLRDMFDLIKMTMPENAPESLGDRAYADLLAYILQANGLPAGPAELEADRERLATIVFEQFGQ